MVPGVVMPLRSESVRSTVVSPAAMLLSVPNRVLTVVPFCKMSM